MRKLLFSITLVAIATVGCNDPQATQSDATPVEQKTAAAKDGVAEGGMAFEEVNAEGLKATLASNKVTLIEFTADW